MIKYDSKENGLQASKKILKRLGNKGKIFNTKKAEAPKMPKGWFDGADWTLFEAIQNLEEGEAIIAKVPGVSYPVPVVAWMPGKSKPEATCGVVWDDINAPAAIVSATEVATPVLTEKVDAPKAPADKFRITSINKTLREMELK